MMSRLQQIAREIIEQLSRWDEPADEAVIHAAINARIQPEPLLSEFSDALHLCEMQRWITGVRNPLRGTRWALTDKGRTERHA